MYDTSTNSANAGAARRSGPITLVSGPNRVVVDPARGGRLASWTIDGEELLLGPPDASDTSIGWGCFVMAPWPGRLAHGAFEWRGRTIRVRRTWGRNAIHGLTWSRPWSVVERATDSATLASDLPVDEWPMGGRVRQRVSVTADVVRLEAEVEAGHEPMPAAIGWHPWFLRRGDPRLRVDAPRYQLTEGMVPTGETAPVRGRTDLRGGPHLGRRRLDLAYLDAQSPAVIAWPDLELRLEFEPSPSPVVVYTPAEVFCVEPLTAPPNAVVSPSGSAAGAGSGSGPFVLQAGASLVAALTLQVRRLLVAPGS